jgi:hypothetical protein
MRTKLLIGTLIWVASSSLFAEPKVSPEDVLYKVGPRYPV